ncbi:unnamed protein product [Cuscuta epithymum]|uniref:HAT C-terminal dimerisation domain-containing protein n=1 Tax=Cuscuta epithymum TaxID=186058 RepID=A0AAV0EH03_9ASTE|nr:unnamed protein product [Cuscuta epithymum]
MRCVAHILNLIVNDGLGLLNKCIQSIRNAVRYARSSPQRLGMFKKCVEKVKIESKGLVIMDVPTRWNSTFLMLQAALKFRKAFDRLIDDDGHYLGYFIGEKQEQLREGPPFDDDWGKAEVFANFLRPFYEVTLKVCCSNTPTIHTVFGDLVKIQGLLKETGSSLLSSISIPMQAKYDKYWGSLDKVNEYILAAMVLDPRHKLEKLEDYLELIHGDGDKKIEAAITSVKAFLYDLQNVYMNDASMSLQTSQPSVGGSVTTFVVEVMKTSSSMTQVERKLAEKEQQRRAKKAGSINNDVDRYLLDSIEGDENSDFDILNWWRVNGVCKYPLLAYIARDILAIPVSTIASESCFSTSGRVIDPFRSSLSPKMVEALICTQNWLRSTHVALHHEPTIEEMEFCEEIEKGKCIVFWFYLLH